MKIALAILLSLSASVASAETILVEPGTSHMFVGDRFDARTATQVLYVDRVCKLPLANAKDMREYTTTSTAQPMGGCWGKTLGGGVMVVFENGMTMESAVDAYVTATVDKEGASVVTKSIYDRKNYEPCARAHQKGQWCLKGQG